MGFHVEVDGSGFPLVAGFDQERRDQAQEGFFIRKNAGDAGAALEEFIERTAPLINPANQGSEHALNHHPLDRDVMGILRVPRSEERFAALF